jgi:hypothetical protein
MTTHFANFSKTDFYTLVTPTATFDIASAIESDFACTWSLSYLPEVDWTYTWCLDYSDKPTAAATSVVYRTAAAPFPPGGVIPTKDARFYDLYTDQPVATHTISVAPNRTFDQVSATPFVHFTAYEVESGNRTETVLLPSAYVYPYWANDVQHDVAAVGPLPDGFLQQIPQADCEAGKLQATVTVVVVVDLYYENIPELSPFLIHFESSVLGWEEDGTVGINNEGTLRGAPLTMADWDLPNVPATTTPPGGLKPDNRPDPTPTTKAGNNNNNSNNQPGAATIQAQHSDGPQPIQVTVGSVGTIPVVIGPASVIIIGSQTLQPGAPAIVVGGVTPVSLVSAATAIVVGGTTTIQLPQVTDQPGRSPPVLTIGSLTLTPNAATQFFFAPGETLTPGGTVTFDGTVVSLAPLASFVVVDGNTQVLPTAVSRIAIPSSLPQIVVGGTTIAALPIQGGSGSPGINTNNNQNNVPNNALSGSNPAPTFVIGGQTLAPGGQAITVSGTTISLAAGGSSVVIDGVPSAVINPPAMLAPTIVIGNNVFTPVSGSGSTFVIADQTLAPGGQAITVSGTVISLAPLASFVVVNGVTSTFATAAAAQITTAPTLTLGNSIIQPLQGTGTSYLIGSSTLTPGGIITVSGTTISLAPGATQIVINGQTSFLAPGSSSPITNAPLLTIGSNTFTALSGTTYVIGRQTLTPGGTITVDGTTISLAPGATQLIYGNSGRSSTTALFPATTTRGPSVTGTANASARGSGGNGQAAATSPRTGSASASRLDVLLLSFALGLILVFC